MNEEPPTISVITDISANIFAVFIVILIILLALPRTEPAPPKPPPPIDALQDLVAVSRKPLSATDMVDLLFQRRRAAASVSVDLFNDRLVLAAPNEAPEEFPLPLGARSIAAIPARIEANATLPVALYVFDHGGYATMQELLGGRAFREISVPSALRGVVEDRQDWREGFRNLIDRATDLDAFREDLGRLLDAPEPQRTPQPLQLSSAAFQAAPASLAAEPTPEGLLGRLAAWLQRAFAASAIGLGIGLIAFVEWRRSSRTDPR